MCEFKFFGSILKICIPSFLDYCSKNNVKISKIAPTCVPSGAENLCRCVWIGAFSLGTVKIVFAKKQQKTFSRSESNGKKMPTNVVTNRFFLNFVVHRNGAFRVKTSGNRSRFESRNLDILRARTSSV